MRCVIVIPARMASTRFPGKPLCDLAGKPMIQWVVEASRKAGIADKVVVATPDVEIADACRQFGGDTVLTGNDHPTGTDRIAEVAESIQADIFVNVQGDEPLIRPESISACAAPLLDDPSIEMGSLYSACEINDHDNPAVVKVVTDLAGYALYFSRFPIPYPRHDRGVELKRHVGIYAYRRETVISFSSWDQSPLEKSESLEQLRFMEHGVRIKMSFGEGSEIGVDTPEQAESVRSILRQRSRK